MCVYLYNSIYKVLKSTRNAYTFIGNLNVLHLCLKSRNTELKILSYEIFYSKIFSI